MKLREPLDYPQQITHERRVHAWSLSRSRSNANRMRDVARGTARPVRVKSRESVRPATPRIEGFSPKTSSASALRTVIAPHRPQFSPLFRRACSPSVVLGGITHLEDAFMRGDSTQLGKADPKAAPARPIVLSRWINEPYPPLTELLSAYDVARLTRRPRWLLVGLTLIGRFPKRARFRGRTLGWWLSDVLEWMARDLEIARDQATSSQPCLRGQPRQTCLSLESAVRIDSTAPKHARKR